MARGSQSRRRRLRKARQAATAAAVATHISSLPDDILREIFLRLPSLATLVRAACACRAWRHAVASSPAFRSRFRALHPAPLLGVFADRHSGLPTFDAAHRQAGPDVLAALRRGDFLLTSLMEKADNDGVPLRWRIADCRDGYLVLINLSTNLIAIVNPLARHRPDYIIGVPRLDTDTTEGVVFQDVNLLSSDKDPMSFRLVCLFHDEYRVTASVFSSETWDWRVLPWVEVDHDGIALWLQFGTQAKGLVCWGFRWDEDMLTLDTETLEFSVWMLPRCSDLQLDDSWRCRSLAAGETKDGTLCIARVTESVIYVWLSDDGGGGKKWILKTFVKYNGILHHGVDTHTPNAVAIRDGFVYLARSA